MPQRLSLGEVPALDLRRIGYLDPATGHRYFFLTNLFRLSPKPIAEIYRSRWQVELFFKWVLCRCRHKSHYADLWIMPTWARKPPSEAVIVVTGSA